MSNFLTKEDNGKNVVTASGENLGSIKSIDDDGHATVETHDDASLTDKIRGMLDMDGNRENADPKVKEHHVDRRDDDRIHLKQP